MGQHFDTLVDLVKSAIPEDVVVSQYHASGRQLPIRQYLSDLIRQAGLFEFPLKAQEVFPQTGKEKAEYDRYLRDYLDLSAHHSHFLAMPFRVTAIEDPVSVVILDPKGGNRYLVTTCLRDDGLQMRSLNLIDCRIDRPQPGAFLGLDLAVLYDGIGLAGAYRSHPAKDDSLVADAALFDSSNAIIAFVEELVYIMDPANFVFEKEQTQSVQARQRAERRGGQKQLLKTVMRPHYICLDEEQTRRIGRETGGSVEAHVVKGHWKTLVSERWVNKRGQRLFISQYFTGEGRIQKPGGWTYEVFVKEDPFHLVRYSERNKE